MTSILHIDASARIEQSRTKKLSRRIVERISETGSEVVRRLADHKLPLLNDAMVAAYFTAADQRSEHQRQAVSVSDQITRELQQSDIIVIGVPIYNFAAPAAFKAWCDLAARVGVTFQYTENGPVGLLSGKRAIIVVASGGTEVNGPLDFFSPWIRHFMSFLGIEDTTIWHADELEANFESMLDDFLSQRGAQAA